MSCLEAVFRYLALAEITILKGSSVIVLVASYMTLNVNGVDFVGFFE